MNQSTLFETAVLHRPLADRARPQKVNDYVGHDDYLGDGKPLRLALQSTKKPSLIIWGPPGCGKTTFARIFAQEAGLSFKFFSAVTASIKDVKAIMDQARKDLQFSGKPTLLFVDEIHRFNRSQQDAFLPYVENGTIVLVGTTTENPSFRINSALISRLQVISMKPLTQENILVILKRALETDPGLTKAQELVSPEILEVFARLSEGDARSALNQLEALANYLVTTETKEAPGLEDLDKIMAAALPRYDKDQENHYDFISALHKSMRNSDVNASLYWMGRMLEGGEDPLYIVRRLVRFASEDIGCAEPEALTTCLQAREVVDFLGLPEAELAIAQAVVRCALAPKSNALYKGYRKLKNDLKNGHRYPVPFHLRNAPTKLMKNIGYGKDYQYAHNVDEKITSMKCLPEELSGKTYFEPGDLGFEAQLKKRLSYWENKRKTKNT